MTFPSPPWELQGQLWVSLFYASGPGHGHGVYAATYADFEATSTLPHRALLIGRLTRDEAGRAIRVVDAWTDTPAAVEGYQAVFGFPAQASGLGVETGGLGPVGRAEWSVPAVAGAHFADTAGVALRTPLRLTTRQPRDDAPVATTPVAGSARSVPCLAAWSIPAEGPLGWLARKQPFTSFRARDARLVLG